MNHKSKRIKMSTTKSRRAMIWLTVFMIMGCVILSGCGKKKGAPEKEAVVETGEEKVDLSDSVDPAEELSESAPMADLSDPLPGTYVYMEGDEVEERIFEISCICGQYYIEYIGYDYAGAEMQINGKRDVENGVEYDVTLYPFSGFSFMGEYWGAGTDCTITAHSDGKITVSKQQPFLFGELNLSPVTGRAVHQAVLDCRKNDVCEEVVGTWRCHSIRDGKDHEITLVFDESGLFEAVDKVSEHPPMLYFGHYDMDSSSKEIRGAIECELFAYGTMPYEWVVTYDAEQKCPVVYEDYTAAEPFTYKEDEKNLPFRKVDPEKTGDFTPGPGARADEVQKMYEDYLSWDILNHISGVWQSATNTPAGDPYVFQLEIGRDGHISYSGYSMTGDRWFEALCYDGSIEAVGNDHHIEISELDENGTETDRIIADCHIEFYDDNVNAIQVSYVSGDEIAGNKGEDVIFTRADRAIRAGDLVLGESTSERKLSREEIRTLEEAIEIFPIYNNYKSNYDGIMDISDEGPGVVEKWKVFKGDSSEYAGLTFETGKAPLPIDHIYYDDLSKGEEADYMRTSTHELERALQEFFAVDSRLDRIGTIDTTVDEDYVTVWGNGYIVSYEGGYTQWLRFEEYMQGDTLVIDGVRESGDEVEWKQDTIRFWFDPTPESFYGYTLRDYKTIQSDGEVTYTLEQIKETEKFVRSYVNTEATDQDKVTLKAGVDGCPYARDLYYISGFPIFAFYHSATDGSVDNRYYFQVGRLVEWIEGNGNDDANRVRHYSSDEPRDPRWKETENALLADFEKYR